MESHINRIMSRIYVSDYLGALLRDTMRRMDIANVRRLDRQWRGKLVVVLDNAKGSQIAEERVDNSTMIIRLPYGVSAREMRYRLADYLFS